MKRGPVYCLLCGHQWARDPVLEVPCTECKARVGSPCVSRAPSGHVKSGAFQGLPAWGHDLRDIDAAAEGFYDHNASSAEGKPGQGPPCKPQPTRPTGRDVAQQVELGL